VGSITIDWNRVLPVLISIGIIISVAILRQYSKTFAAIAATMPINVPLGLWIVYAGAPDPEASLREFSEAALLNIFPTVFFIIAAYFAARAGLAIIPTILIGYVVWAVSLGGIYLIRSLIMG
jgi:positive regulator of sigma E activity